MLGGTGLKRTFRVAAAYVGAVVGAGFASGQETLVFFTIHGRQGILGLMLAGVLFALFGMVILRLARVTGSESYTELLESLLGRTLGATASITFSLFLMAGLAVMLSGSRTVAEEHMGLPGWFGLGLCLASVCIALARQNQGVLDLNGILVPLLLAIMLVACLPAFSTPEPVLVPPGKTPRWILSTLLYFSYNAIIAMAVLVPLSREAPIWAGALGGIVLGSTGLYLGLALMNSPFALEQEVPMVHLALRTHPFMGWAYGIALWAAMTTTAIATAYALSSRLSASTGLPLPIAAASVLLVALPLGTLRFSHLVASLYPFWGYAALTLLGVALVRVPLTGLSVAHRRTRGARSRRCPSL